MAVATLRPPYEKTYGYDAAGRTISVVTSAGTTTLAYDYEGRISTITYPSSATNSFTYNGLDTRVGKVDSAGTTTYRRDGDDVLSPVLEAGGTKFTPGISRRTGTSSYFYHQDRMGSAVRQTNSTQGSLTSRQYDAFGNVAYVGGTWVGPFGFVGGEGYQEDSDSGLQLLGHRYYDSSTGRFLTRDKLKAGRNWYGYVGNNPLRKIDPIGLVAITLEFSLPIPAHDIGLGGGIYWNDKGIGLTGGGHYGVGPTVGSPVSIGIDPSNNQNPGYGVPQAYTTVACATGITSTADGLTYTLGDGVGVSTGGQFQNYSPLVPYPDEWFDGVVRDQVGHGINDLAAWEAFYSR